ncbi:MAG: EVE domain-containing protein [Gemmatimonadota bacterium]|nr:MAG: EVE domain-containing protein [Gemmatimonadota bacterium]
MPKYWLLKSEPEEYSYEDLEREGQARWDGVRNPQALKHMRATRPGDLALFYHTGKEKAIVGIARIESEPYPDPEADDERRVVFDIRANQRLAAPVTLASIKAERAFADWELVRLPRLSVMPVSKQIWDRVIALTKRS